MFIKDDKTELLSKYNKKSKRTNSKVNNNTMRGHAASVPGTRQTAYFNISESRSPSPSRNETIKADIQKLQRKSDETDSKIEKLESLTNELKVDLEDATSAEQFEKKCQNRNLTKINIRV